MTYLLYSTYFGIALLALCLLSLAILRIGEALGPDAACTRTAALTVATGYSAIGFGGVLMIAALLASIEANMGMTLAGIGFIVAALGLGFANAVTTLRAVLASRESE